MNEAGYLLMLMLFSVVSVLYLVLSSIGEEKSVTDKKERNTLFLFGLVAVTLVLFINHPIADKEHQVNHKDQGECHDSTSK